MARIYLGNAKGQQGATGATGATGAAGSAATVEVGTVTSTAYGNPAQVTNSGTDTDAVLDFVIPQGAPGEEVTDLSNLSIGSITTQTGSYPTPQIGDTGATLVGKIIKYFSDLRTLIGTKLNIANVVNNKTTTEEGYALDARQANPNVSGSLGAKIQTLNNNLTSIGSYTTTPSTNTSVSSDSQGSTIVDSIEISYGKYLIIAMAKYSSNTTGIRFISLSITDAMDGIWDVSVPAAPTGSSYLQLIRYIDATSTTHDVKLFARQNSGATLTVTTRLFAIKLA